MAISCTHTTTHSTSVPKSFHSESINVSSWQISQAWTTDVISELHTGLKLVAPLYLPENWQAKKDVV